jgi:hypothetical protein
MAQKHAMLGHLEHKLNSPFLSCLIQSDITPSDLQT